MRQLLQPITAYVYCIRQAPPAGASTPPAVGERQWTGRLPGASGRLRNGTRPWTPPIP